MLMAQIVVMFSGMRTYLQIHQVVYVLRRTGFKMSFILQ